jgi:peptidoglycan-associated lipoprotein
MKNMKSKTLFNLIALSAALAISAIGCRHTPQKTSTIYGTAHPVNPNAMPIDNSQPMPNPNGNGIITTPAGGGPLPAGGFAGWAANSDILADQTIHFDYDKSAIKAHEQPKLDAVADYLKNHAGIAVRVEGNCDERGTEEYNRSLGERRALAARERLVQAGVDPSRLDIITYGKDKPVDPGHDESAFAKNRRDDFVVLTPPGQ